MYTWYSLLTTKIWSSCVTVLKFSANAGGDSSTLVEIIGGVLGALGSLAAVVLIIVVIWKRRCAYISK